MRIDAISQLLQGSDARGSRSTVLSPLGWLIAIEVLALSSCLRFAAPDWVLKLVGATIALSVLVYIGAYIYFAATSPESLRSERFWLQRMALEKVVRGDSVAGFVFDDRPVVEAGTAPNAVIGPKGGK